MDLKRLLQENEMAALVGSFLLGVGITIAYEPFGAALAVIALVYGLYQFLLKIGYIKPMVLGQQQQQRASMEI